MDKQEQYNNMFVRDLPDGNEFALPNQQKFDFEISKFPDNFRENMPFKYILDEKSNETSAKNEKLRKGSAELEYSGRRSWRVARSSRPPGRRLSGDGRELVRG